MGQGKTMTVDQSRFRILKDKVVLLPPPPLFQRYHSLIGTIVTIAQTMQEITKMLKGFDFIIETAWLEERDRILPRLFLRIKDEKNEFVVLIRPTLHYVVSRRIGGPFHVFDRMSMRLLRESLLGKLRDAHYEQGDYAKVFLSDLICQLPDRSERSVWEVVNELEAKGLITISLPGYDVEARLRLGNRES